MKNNICSLVIDGNYLLFQSFYATYRGDLTQILRNSNGVPTNAIAIFLSQLIKLLKFIEPTHLMIAFDAHGKTKRHNIFPEYKSGRIKAPQELFDQFDYIKKILTLLNIKWIEQIGDEADDIIGTYCKKMSGEKYIFSSDKDLLQLVDLNTSYIIKKGLDISIVNLDNFYQIYQLNPSQITTFKGLKGDTSDNLPGVPGIGDKTALKLIGAYNNFENLYQLLELGQLNESKSIIEKLSKGKDSGLLSYELSKINTNVQNLNLDIDFYLLNINYDNALDYLNELELEKFKLELKRFLNKK